MRVAVASNFTPAMKEIAAEFEKSTGHRVILSFGSSGKFYAQIKNGAPFQLFFSADTAKPEALEREGFTVPGSRFTYAIGGLVLWSASSDLLSDGISVLREGTYNRLALANSKLAPYGVAAEEVLHNLGLQKSTQAKWVRGENIAQTYQFVASGNAELGFVALSQVMHNGRIDTGATWIVPSHLYHPIRQDAVLLSGSNSAAAAAFLRFVRGDKARAIIRSYGYRLPESR
ncbi:molybdate ABC transporter substrate-binding protein [Microbulbifer thermotolerans]|uniref:molybdate ABC transporter substrate-binding protein n=1 Tax=Microbulbifer thermotolerans TaxID=252514 RepID=UPI00224B1FFE|nr:molybdate ABC transporter substrate-binding protein [Microbulbifer thermotolerans]MCX2779721.1 molybdate ABC transporter substrate-binding protein [Microbulbifer thermotolerans]MCX2805108.1 molybdate ABC transporter substrate-binding protein [Microbulbifer thermotolerans]